MWLLIVEAIAAGGMFIFIIWWTMSGRHKPEQHVADSEPAPLDAAERDAPASRPPPQA